MDYTENSKIEKDIKEDIAELKDFVQVEHILMLIFNSLRDMVNMMIIV